MLCSVVVAFDPTYFGTNDNETSCSTQEPVEGCEEGAKEAKSSEAKVTVADLLCRTLHSFWLCFHSCPPFPHGRRKRSALFPLLFVLGCHSRPSSHALTLPRSSYFHSLLASILVKLLSPPTAPWSIKLAAPSLLRCPILAASSSLPHPRCLVLAASSALLCPCCLILAALYPRCKSSPQLPIFAPLTLLTLINRPLQVLVSPPTSGTPSFGAIPFPVYIMSSALSPC